MKGTASKKTELSRRGKQPSTYRRIVTGNVNGKALLIFFVQVWVVVHVVRRLTSRHARPPVRPTVLRVSMLVLAILLSLSWGRLIVFGIPRLFGMPLITTVVRVSDFGYVLLMCAFLAFSTSILKGLVGLSFFSNIRQVHTHLN